MLAACDNGAEPLRQWKPSDHAHPPSSQVDPSRVRGTARPQVSVAALLFQKHCARCHGSDGRGGAEAAIDLSAADVQARLSEASIAKTISQGKPPMPGFAAELDAAQIEALVGYVRGLGARPGPTGLDDAAR